jgi:hypothetical protein
MHPHYKSLFVAVHAYLRSRHGRFLSECFLDGLETEWTLCARPTEANIRARALDPAACKYFRLSLEEAKQIHTFGDIDLHLKDWISGELRAIRADTE